MRDSLDEIELRIALHDRGPAHDEPPVRKGVGSPFDGRAVEPPARIVRLRNSPQFELNLLVANEPEPAGLGKVRDQRQVPQFISKRPVHARIGIDLDELRHVHCDGLAAPRARHPSDTPANQPVGRVLKNRGVQEYERERLRAAT